MGYMAKYLRGQITFMENNKGMSKRQHYIAFSQNLVVTSW